MEPTILHEKSVRRASFMYARGNATMGRAPVSAMALLSVPVALFGSPLAALWTINDLLRGTADALGVPRHTFLSNVGWSWWVVAFLFCAVTCWHTLGSSAVRGHRIAVASLVLCLAHLAFYVSLGYLWRV